MNQFGLLLFGGITSMLIVSKSKSAKNEWSRCWWGFIRFTISFASLKIPSIPYYEAVRRIPATAINNL